MPCFYPLNGYRTAGGVSLREPFPPPPTPPEILKLPCGSCIGCAVRQARDWAVRCCLEASQHEETAFVTLTYDDAHLPPDGFVSKAHLSGWLKRVRARLHADDRKLRKAARRAGRSVPPFRRIKFFACGEYGEETQRPHYHCLLFGLRDHASLQESWPFGFVRVDTCTPASISYVAGYVGKKIGSQTPPTFSEYHYLGRPGKPLPRSKHKRVHPAEWAANGRVSAWCDDDGQIIVGPNYVRWTRRKDPVPGAPFRLMSRRPGIGGDSRAFVREWRTSAIWRGREVPVPRYLHLAYKLAVSEEEYAKLQEEKRQSLALRDTSRDRLRAGEKIARSLLTIKKESRSL